MQIKKWIATGLAALMAGATFAGASLAATQLGAFPGFLASKTATSAALDAFIVVGKDAKTSDVVGAADLAARLAEQSYTVETLKGTTVSGITGVDRDGVSIGTVSGGARLEQGGTDYSNPFPTGNVIKNFHFSGLKSSQFTWKSTKYDFHEQVYLGGVRVRHDFGTTNINGTLKLEVESGDIIYQYVMDKTLNGTGTSSSDKNYNDPVNIEMMGQKFAIVSAYSNSVIALTGSIGTADATTPVKYGDYSVFATLGSNANWVKAVVQDAAGNTVNTLVINQGSTKTSTASGLDVQATAVRALTDGTVVGADLVVGPQGTTEKTYDTSADTSSTGTASDKFTGTTDWGIRVASGNISTVGQLTANHMLEVVYQPTTTQYLKAGEKIAFPNNYAELGLKGYGTEKLVTVTIEPITSQSAYNSSASSQVVGSSLNGLKISADVAGSIVSSSNNGYDAAYVLFGKFLPGQLENKSMPVYFGFWDNVNSRVKTADFNASLGELSTAQSGQPTSQTNPTTTVFDSTNNRYVVTSEYGWVNLNNSMNNKTTGGAGPYGAAVMYPFKISYGGAGEKGDYYLNITVTNESAILRGTRAGDKDNFNVQFAFKNKTTWSQDIVPEFRLGDTTATTETTEVNSTTEASANNVGTSSQNIVDDNGIIIVSPSSNGGSEKAKFQVPSKDLTARVYLGKDAGTGTSGADTTYNKISPITAAVAKLDTEIGTAEKAKNLVIVGGPCVNKLAAEALGKTYPACGASSGIAEKTAQISVWDDAFAKGKVALLVMGWEADDTRLATSVLQNYDKHLKGVTASKVTVTGTVAIPVITAAS